MDDIGLILSLIYDTILDQDRWADALQAIGRFVSATYTALVVEDAETPTASRFVMTPDNDLLISRYTGGFMLMNPMRLATLDSVAPGDVVLTPDFMTRRQYQQTRFYVDFMQPLGLSDVAAAVLEIEPKRIGVLSMIRGTTLGPADDEMRRRIIAVAPHVRRAVSAGRSLSTARGQVATMMDLLDRMAGAVLLLDRDGVVLHANAAALAVLATNAPVQLVDGRLVPRDQVARARLAAALEAAEAGDTGPIKPPDTPARNGADPATIAFTAPGRDPLAGIVIPLRRGQRRATTGQSRAVAAIFLRPPRFTTPAAAQTLRSLHGLTPREMTVVVSMAESGGVSETASVLGLSELTVRTHLRSIYRKTGCTRHADLVRLVSGLASPFG